MKEVLKKFEQPRQPRIQLIQYPENHKQLSGHHRLSPDIIGIPDFSK
jgi:hypothetical protein